VDVDEAGGDGETRGVEVLGLGLDTPDRRDAAVLDQDVGAAAVGAGAVVDRAVSDRDPQACTDPIVS
jgi:hypothetical protein